MLINSRLKRGLRCSSECVTRDHLTFGECIRSKNLRLNPNLSDTGSTKRWDSELQAYRDARRQGIQPAGTTMPAIDKAVRISDASGVAYDANRPVFDVKVA